MTGAITIRAQEPEDAAAINRILMQPGVLPTTLQTPYTSLAVRREQVAAQQPGLHRLVAVIDGEVVGSASIQVYQRPRRSHAGDIGLAVDERFQGRGIGTRLLAELLGLADDWLGVRRVELTVAAGNTHAIRLYERYGFRIEGRLREYALTDGVYADVLVMGRLRHEVTPDHKSDTGEVTPL